MGYFVTFDTYLRDGKHTVRLEIDGVPTNEIEIEISKDRNFYAFEVVETDSGYTLEKQL